MRSLSRSLYSHPPAIGGGGQYAGHSGAGTGEAISVLKRHGVEDFSG